MFNQKTKNAIRIVTFLADNQELNKKCGATKIATKIGVSQPFTSKILQDLARHNIITSTKGRGGGFYISETNQKKTIIDLISVFEDHMQIYECILGLPQCTDENPCVLHHIYKDFKMEIGAFLKKNIGKIIPKN